MKNKKGYRIRSLPSLFLAFFILAKSSLGHYTICPCHPELPAYAVQIALDVDDDDDDDDDDANVHYEMEIN